MSQLKQCHKAVKLASTCWFSKQIKHRSNKTTCYVGDVNKPTSCYTCSVYLQIVRTSRLAQHDRELIKVLWCVREWYKHNRLNRLPRYQIVTTESGLLSEQSW